MRLQLYVSGVKSQSNHSMDFNLLKFRLTLLLFFITACGGPPQQSTEGSETPALLERVSGTVTSFPDLVVGSSLTILVEIENLSSTVPASNLSSASDLGDPYAFTGGIFPGTGGTCTVTLGAGSRCSIELSIAPLLVGSFSESLLVQYYDGIQDQVLVIDLQSQSRDPFPANLVINPTAPQNFGVVAIGGTSDIAVSLTNNGERPASALSFTGIVSPFSVQNSTCVSQLDPGETCQWLIRYEPTLAVASSGSLQIDYDDGTSVQSLSLDMSGEGRVAGFIAVDEGLTFDYQVILGGSTSTRTLTLRNTGGGNASALNWINLSAPFSLSANTCPSLLAPGANCQIQVEFSPTLTGDSNDNLGLQYFDGFVTQTLTAQFSGSGYSSAPSIALISPSTSPSTLNNPTFRIGNLVDGLSVNLYRNSLCSLVESNGASLGPSLDLNPIIPEGSFSFHVRVSDADGNQSACSTASVIYEYDNTAPQPPTNITYSIDYTTVSTRTPNFSWNLSPSDDVVAYEVGVSGSAAGGNALSGWTSKGNVTSSFQSGLSLTECQYYYVSVRSRDDVGLSSTIHAVSITPFRYDSSPPTPPSNLNEGSDGSSSNSATISWLASSDACGLSHYEIAVSEDMNNNNILDPGEVGNAVAFTNVGILTTHRFNGLTLTNGVPHFTSIRAVDTTGRFSNVAVSDPWIVYDPSIELPDMIVWLDANDPASVLDSNGRDGLDPLFNGQVNRWIDKSGSPVDHDFTLGSGATRPVYDELSFEMIFNGSNTGLTTANHSEINTATVDQRNLTVAFQTSTDVLSRQIIYEEGGGIRGMNIYLFNGRIYCGFYNTPDDGDGAQPFVEVNAPALPGRIYFVTWVFDYTNYTTPSGPDGDLECFVNGASIGATTTTSKLFAHSGRVGLGRVDNDTCFEDNSCPSSGSNFSGSLFEVMLFNNAPDAASVSNVHTYLDNKWN